MASAKHAQALPLRAVAHSAMPPGRPVTVGFFVNWDDNSFVSLKSHVAQLDWIVCEWLFLGAQDDSLHARIDRRVLYLRESKPIALRPHVLAMLTNYDSAHSDFDPALLRRFGASPAGRARIIASITRKRRRRYSTRTICMKRTQGDAELQATALCAILNLLGAKRPQSGPPATWHIL